MTYEIINGWIVGKLPGPDGALIPVRHFPQGPYERRQRNNPMLCLHTTETQGYVEELRFPSEFQVGEDVIGQHRPLWARGSAVDEHDHDLLQIEIVGFSKLDHGYRNRRALSARRTDGAPASPRLRCDSAETSGSVAGPARSPSGGRGHVLPTPRGLGRAVRVRPCRDPRRRTLGTRVRSTIRRCFRWSATFWLRRRSMARCFRTIRSRGSSSRTGCAVTWIVLRRSPRSPDRTARGSGSRGASRCISRVSHRRQGSNPRDPRPKAWICHPRRRTRTRGGQWPAASAPSAATPPFPDVGRG